MLLQILIPAVVALAPDSWLPLNEQGNELRERGQCRQAISVLTRSRAAAVQELGPKHPKVAVPLNNLAVAYLCLGEFGRAERHFHDALELLAGDPDLSLKAGILNNLGIALTRMSRLSEAERVLAEALSLTETLFGPQHPQTAIAITSVGMIRFRTGDYTRAGELFRRAADIWEVSLGTEHLHTAAAFNNLGAVDLYLGHYEEARQLTARALEIRCRLLPAAHPDIAQSLYNYAVSLDKLGLRKPARDAFRQAASIVRVHGYENMMGITVDLSAIRKRR